MAVKIRLRRMGKKKQPTYRVVVADARSPRDGRIIESIGRYDPRRDPSLVEIDNDRARYWLGTGAQPTDRVQKLLEISGAVAQPKVSRAGVYRLDDPPQSSPPDPDVTESPEAAEDSAAEGPAAAPEEDQTPADDQQDGEA
ncbi:MAG: 30S ribosomal protein S16 [bacterium]|nr:30S ribosomal protein S16 [bacterium]MDE0374724.1 30S ribosomal protein S16 [bacterium]